MKYYFIGLFFLIVSLFIISKGNQFIPECLLIYMVGWICFIIATVLSRRV